MRITLNPITRWLGPSARSCRLCGRQSAVRQSVPCPVRHPDAAAILRFLCSACSEAIPWIHRPICRICGRPEVCPDCPRREERYVVFSRSAVRYDNRMKELLALYKYRGSERLEAIMAAILSSAYERICTELTARVAKSHFRAITSVPLAQERLEERGFNQAERMARLLAGWYGIPYLPLLRRNRHTEKQSLKTRRSRLTDMRGNFSADPVVLSHLMEACAQAEEPVRILIADDVYTTGSTLNECARAVRTALPPLAAKRLEIYGLLWARS